MTTIKNLWAKIPATWRTWLEDAGERVAATWWQAFFAAMLTSLAAHSLSVSTTEAAALGGLAAALSAVKAIVAAKFPTFTPASWLPRKKVGKNGLAASAHAGQVAGESLQRVTAAFDAAYASIRRLDMLPAPSGRKHGALPSPRDDRDWKAKLTTTRIPSSVDNGAGLTFGMLLNDQIGDCYPAALLHALQILSGGRYTPTDDDALYVYEQVSGYQPGNSTTDNGTVGRQLFAWAKARGIIDSYAVCPTDEASIKAAIASPHKVVLCEWALPTGAESEGVNWHMPRAGRVAGSWGYHATAECGYTSERSKNVTWGAEGSVTNAFEEAYLQAGWVITVPPTIPPIRG